MKRRLFLGIVLSAVVLLLSIGGYLPKAQAQAADIGLFRVIHAAPEAPAVDVYIDAGITPIISNLQFGQATNFLPLISKGHNIFLRVAGAPFSSEPIFVRQFPLSPNSAVNIVIVGIPNSIGWKSFHLMLVPVNFRTTNGKPRIQLIHASLDTPPLDLLADGSVIIPGLKYADGLFTGVNVPVGTYDLDIVQSGVTSPVLISMPGFTLASNTLYTIVALDNYAQLKSIVMINPILAN